VCGGKDDPDERDGSWAFTIPRLHHRDMGTGMLGVPVTTVGELSERGSTSVVGRKREMGVFRASNTPNFSLYICTTCHLYGFHLQSSAGYAILWVGNDA